MNPIGDIFMFFYFKEYVKMQCTMESLLYLKKRTNSALHLDMLFQTKTKKKNIARTETENFGMQNELFLTLCLVHISVKLMISS